MTQIIVFDDGQITEQGTHDELMMLKGVYAEMYNLQVDKYLSKD